ncbi:phage tail tape measure protein [Pseudomonas putida]|nr:phage tail tape measure protein [Pseudomonas putida]
MASRLALSLVIGGAVASSVGAAFKTVENGIQKLEAKGNKARVLKSTIGETIKLRDEWKRAHDSGAAGADKLQRKLDSNLDTLRKQGVEVGRLSREYQRLGREAKAADLQLKGHQQLQAGKSSLKSNIGQAVVATGAAAVPTMISANYQAIIRDIAIKADIVNKPQEQQLTRTVIDTAADTGMARNDVADLVNQLVGAGMELDKALSYAPVAAKFAIGQGASGVDTASMIQALEQNAKISDPKVMQQALEAIAYQGQAGSFEASDMAKWFPQLLAGMEKNGITGLDAVTSLGSMLQVQMKTAGSSDEAANNFKNWMEKIGSSEVVKAYKDAGIDYQGSLNTGLQKGMNVIEASMALAMKYVEATDPAKAKQIEAAKANIDKEVDPEKARAALEALEKTLRTGDIFADMQVKAALTAYGQNRGLYEELKADSKKATGILDKNLAERRETSAQQWAETVQAADDAMRSIGDAIRPATDMAAKGLTAVARGITTLSDKFPAVVTGIVGTVAAILALKTASSAFKIGRGVFNIARGRGLEGLAGRVARGGRTPIELPKTGNKVVDTGLGVLGKVFSSRSTEAAPANDTVTGGNDPQRVFVVNADAIGGIGSSIANSAPAASAKGSRRSRRRERRRAVRQGTAVRPAAKVEAPQTPVARPRPSLPAASAALTGADELGKVARSVRGVTRLAKRLPGGNLIDAGATALDVALNAKTQDEKAEGYGGAAGSLAGTLAGAAAGAAIGSVVPVIGTAVGGAVGAVLGGLGGESLGGWLGKRWFGDEQPEAEDKAEPPLPAAPKPAPMPPVVVDNRVTAAKAVPTPPRPALGDAVRNMATSAPAESSVSYEPRDPESLGANLVPSQAQPQPAPAMPPAKLSETVREVPGKSTPVPVVIDNHERKPSADAVPPQAFPQPATPSPGVGGVVRDLAAKPVPAAPRVPELVQPANAAAPGLGDAVRQVEAPMRPAPKAGLPVGEMSDEEIERRHDQLPAFAKRDLFEGVGGFSGTGAGLGEDFSPTLSLDPPAAPPRPAPVPVDNGQALGMVMRDLVARPVPAAPRMPELAQPTKAAVPGLGDTVRQVETPARPAPKADLPVGEMSDEEIERRYDQLPAFAKRDLFEGVGGFSGTGAGLGEDFSPTLSLDAPAAPPRPAPVPVDTGQALGMVMRELAKVPQVPAVIAPAITKVVDRSQPELLKGEQGGPLDKVGLGEVVRDMVAKSVPAAPRMPEMAQPVKAATPAPAQTPKVDQSFSFAPSIKIDVQGDVKDPSQVVREIESPLRRLFDTWQREVSARMSSAQLYDQPHV